MRNPYLLEAESFEPGQTSGEFPIFQETGFSQAWMSETSSGAVNGSPQVCEVLDNFDFDRDQLKSAHQAQLATLAMKIIQGQASRQPVRSVHMIGHTDPVGSARYNETLGRRRAEQVRGALQIEMERIRRGSTSQIAFSVSSRGESQPISRDNARNRRVEICLDQPLRPAPQPRPPAQPPAALPQDLQALRNNMIRIAIAEWERWGRGSRKETESSMQPILRKYWEEGVGMTYPGPGRAWSAAFISWVVKQAGAGSAFHYSAAHTRYVAAAKRNRLQNNNNPFKAYRVNEIKPQSGDIVCFERKNKAGQWSGVNYDNVDDGQYRASHCDIVTEAGPDGLMKIGGNVSNSVSKKRVPVGPDGYINDPHYYAIIRLTASGSSPTPRPSSPPPSPAGGGTKPRPQPSQNVTPHCAPPSNLTEAERTALSVTTNFETGVPFGCAVSKVDGISMGMLQWNLKAGTLQAMLRQFEQSGGNLQNFFGNQAEAVRRLMAMPREEAVRQATSQKLASLWRQSLLRLCSDSLYCSLQVRDIKQRMASAQSAARTLGLQTARGLSMMFDINVGDGLSRRKLTDFKTRLASLASARGRALSEREKLVEIADRAATYAGRWADERRARRRVIANGQGIYRRSNWNLDRLFPGLDRPIR